MYRALFAVTVAALCACQAQESELLDPENPTLTAVQASSDFYPGLFDSYRDRTTGDIYFLLRPAQLGRDYLYFSMFLDGNSEFGTQRGIFAEERLVRLKRDYDQLQILELNTHFYFDPGSALAGAADANLLPAVLAVAEIVDEDDSGNVLVRANSLFLDESLQQIKPATDSDDADEHFTLGKLSTTRTRIAALHSYPRNLDVVVDYVYEDAAPKVAGPQAVIDSRYVSTRVQHSFLEAPPTAMAPRFEDPRVGFFTKKVTDMTDIGPSPWRDPITRWRLEKRDPDAALSEPVQPIVFWIENTTPRALRDTVRDAVLVWNEAFRDAGFSNAIEVRQQPDDADWDARDLRYNVLRWTSSTESDWAGYGPSLADPRSGEILAADIMLEFDWIRRQVNRTLAFDQVMPQPSRSARRHCDAGALRKSQIQLGRALLAGKPNSTTLEGELVRQSIYDLVSHEVGHALGLNHNFRASYYHSSDDLAAHETLEPTDVLASIMDYPVVNYVESSVEQPRFFNLGPGVYDRWAIQFGYSPALGDAEAEAARLASLLSRSTEPGLGFGIDSDAMTTSDSGIDPRVMQFDMGSDPLVFAERRLDLIALRIGELLSRLAQTGESWQAIYDAYLSMSAEQARQFVVASRWIGGVYVDRSVQGQPGSTSPFTPVERERQKRAMALLEKRLFAPGALSQDEDLYRHLQQQRRGNEHWGLPQDPKLHARALSMQGRVLAHLLHPVTMTRISDSALYGNQYTLHEMLGDLTRAVFAADMDASVDTFRQQLQSDYVSRLLVVADPELDADADEDEELLYDYLSRSAAVFELIQVRKSLAAAEQADLSTRAHRASLMHQIDAQLDLHEGESW